MVWGSNPGRANNFRLLQMSIAPLGHMKLPFQWVSGFCPGCKAAGGVKLTTHFSLVPRLRMSGAIRLLRYMLSWRVRGNVSLIDVKEILLENRTVWIGVIWLRIETTGGLL
jgi:hypothetical protein